MSTLADLALMNRYRVNRGVVENLRDQQSILAKYPNLFEGPQKPWPWHRRLRFRLWQWWYFHRPRLHLGPCRYDDDD